DDLGELVLGDGDRPDAGKAAEPRQPLDGHSHDLELDDALVMHEGLDAARRAFGDDRAIPDHGDPVAYGIGLEHVMGRQEDRLAGVRELPDDDAQLARPDWIEPDGR